jgi:hypothetical protein
MDYNFCTYCSQTRGAWIVTIAYIKNNNKKQKSYQSSHLGSGIPEIQDVDAMLFRNKKKGKYPGYALYI